MSVHRSVSVKLLLSDRETVLSLMEEFNRFATLLASMYPTATNAIALQKATYHQLRSLTSLPAQFVLHAIRRVCGANGYVQYDSPTIHTGRKYPQVSIEKFLNWAKEDVTNKMPSGDEWRQ